MLSLCPKEFAAEHEWVRSIELTKKQSRSSAASMDGTCLSLHRRGIGPSMTRTTHVTLRTLAAQAKSEDPFRDRGKQTQFLHVYGSSATKAQSRAVERFERAPRRSDALEKRRKLMEAWASYCEPNKAGNAIQIGNRKQAESR